MRTSVVALALAVVGCSVDSRVISAQLARRVSDTNTTRIDLSTLGPASWERVCVLTPYSTNEHAARVLGFAWDAEGKTDIATNEGINVLVFVRQGAVTAHVEHPRHLGDLSELSPLCLERASAVLVRRVRSDGWVQLVADKRG